MYNTLEQGRPNDCPYFFIGENWGSRGICSTSQASKSQTGIWILWLQMSSFFCDVFILCHLPALAVFDPCVSVTWGRQWPLFPSPEASVLDPRELRAFKERVIDILRWLQVLKQVYCFSLYYCFFLLFQWNIYVFLLNFMCCYPGF